VLDMTVSAAAEFFAGDRDVLSCLEPLAAVGLDYLRLGQPVPTLSGGEAQRLKLAGHLADAAQSKTAGSSLFLFDEPTTGLHFDDVAKLLGAFKRLLDAGHSIVVIEHNLDVIRAADWILDLGPEGGHAGGQLVAAGTPAAIMACAASHTGRALNEYERDRQRVLAEGRASLPAAIRSPSSLVADRGRDSIVVHKAREHNLRDVDVSIPRDGMTVVTGVSGSGKSTLAFDIVFAEGQRRYLESLNAYARQFVQPSARPDVDAIYGIPPTVAIEQRTSRGGRKSTVGTLTEVHHFLRLLYVKLGVQHCPDCGTAIEPQTADAIAARLLRACKGQRIELLAPLIVSRKGYYTDLAKWALGKGHTELRVDGERVSTERWPRLDRFKEHTIELSTGVLEGLGAKRTRPARRAAACARLRQGCRARARARPDSRLFDAPRLCLVRPQLCGARPAALFVQLEARLVRDMLRHWCAHQGLRRRAVGRGDLVERVVRRRGYGVCRLRWTAAESRGAARHLP
jgi:excinuclease ABC subunit A